MDRSTSVTDSKNAVLAYIRYIRLMKQFGYMPKLPTPKPDSPPPSVPLKVRKKLLKQKLRRAK